MSTQRPKMGLSGDGKPINGSRLRPNMPIKSKMVSETKSGTWNTKQTP